MEMTQMSKISRNIKISVIIALILAIFSGGLLVRKNRRDEEGRRIYNLSMQVDQRVPSSGIGVPLHLCRTPDCQWSHRFCTANENGAVCETVWNRNTSDVYVQRVRNAVCFGRNDGPGSRELERSYGNNIPQEFVTANALRINSISRFTDMVTLYSPLSPLGESFAGNLLFCRGNDLVVSIRVPTSSNPRWHDVSKTSLFSMIQD